MRNIIVYRIANPIYHNPRTIITQITYCTDCMLLTQIPNIVRCNVVDICNEKTVIIQFQFSAANLALAGLPQTNALGEDLPSRYLNMFNSRLCNAATIRYSILKCGHMHLCDKGYKYFSPHCCKCNSFGCIAAIRCGNTCHGPHGDSVYSGSEHRQYNSPRLVKREAGFPSPWRALIGSYQL